MKLALYSFFIRALSFDALVDVDAAADVAHEFAGIVGIGYAAIENPPIGTIVTLQPIFHFERHSHIEPGTVDIEATIEIVGVHTLDPAISCFLLQCATCKVEPNTVEIIAKLGAICAPNHYR